MLESQDTVYENFISPISGFPLKRVGNELVINGQSNGIESFPIIDEMPVIIDFDHSILEKESFLRSKGQSVVKRSYSVLFRSITNVINPTSSKTLNNVEEFIRLLKAQSKFPKVLIVGGGTIGSGMEMLYNDPEIKITSFDIYFSKNCQFIADAHKIPLKSDFYDGVIVQAVLEHVLDPRMVALEIFRVLNPTGIVYAETPFIQHVHEAAYDFTRFTDLGHIYLFREFTAISTGWTYGAGTQLLWSISYYFAGIFRSRSAGNIVSSLLFWLRYLEKFIPEAFNLDAASGVYFLGRKSNEVLSGKELVKMFKGVKK